MNVKDRQKFLDRIKINMELQKKQEKIENGTFNIEDLNRKEKDELLKLYKLQIFSKKAELFELKETLYSILKKK